MKIALSDEFHFGKRLRIGVPPPPTLSKSLDWRGVCKNALQNLEPLGVRGQNIDNKGVADFFLNSAPAASALTMIDSLDFVVKVRCHRASVEKNIRELGVNLTKASF
jgi:hypothetical protein